LVVVLGALLVPGALVGKHCDRRKYQNFYVGF
jgi:hypothetical protein